MKNKVQQSPQRVHSLIHKVIPSLALIGLLAACTPPTVPLTGTPHYGGNSNVPLTSSRLSSGSQPLVVFIEGDGRAYITRTSASGNPTPLNPVALQLAQQTAALPNSNVLYLARPCMWQAPQANCRDNTLWTERRFNASVIAPQVSYIKELSAGSTTPITLVGYSGGAAIALHAAAALKQSGTPVRVITIAGNLDPAATNHFHQLSQMPDWAPTPYATLGTIPQKHLIGQNDTIIPPTLTEEYSITLGSKCSEPAIIPAATHATGWNEAFAKALSEPFACQP